MPSAEDLGSNKTNSNDEDGLAIALSSIDKEAFLRLPGCLQRQFSLEQVNHVIGKTNKYIVTKGTCSQRTLFFLYLNRERIYLLVVQRYAFQNLNFKMVISKYKY